MKKSLKLFTLAFALLFAITVKVSAACTDNCAAQVGTEKYATVKEAIDAVENNGTVELLAGEFSEEIKTGRIDKSFTIVGAANHTTVLTGGLQIGTDNSTWGVQDYTVTVKGIAFKNKGIYVADIRNVNIEDNKLEDMNDDVIAAIRVIDPAIDAVESDVVIKNNTIDGAEQGIRIRTGYNIEITGNVVKNTQHNSITIEHGAKWAGNEGTVVISDNTLENWALGGEGRSVRAAFGAATQLEKEISFTGNKMLRDNEPVEEYAKITGVGTTAVDFEKNYWNSDTPDFEKIISVEGGNEEVEVTEYYKEETMQEKDLNTYVAPKEEVKNPETGDNVVTYILIGLMSLIAFGYASNKLRKNA